jgi:hypothetical protein
MKKLTITIISILTTINLVGSEYFVTLDNKHYKNSVVVKPTVVEEPIVEKEPSPYSSGLLIQTDYRINGDSKATLDTNTGLEWLVLDQTRGKSMNQINDLLSTTLSGWRFPTTNEVDKFMIHFGGSGLVSYHEYSSITYFNKAKTNLGIYKNGYGHEYSGGIYSNDVGSLFDYSLLVAGARMVNFSPQKFLSFRHNNFSNDFSEASVIYGVYLVSDGGVTLTSIETPAINTPAE